MSRITDLWKHLDKFEKLMVVFTTTFIFGILVVVSYYALFGKTLIENIYHGHAYEVLNNLIKCQHKYPLEHYLLGGSLLFKRIIFLSTFLYTFIAASSFFLYRLIFSDKKAPLSIAVLLPVLAVATLYYINPSWRIYSSHGFYRAGIVYQIINGSVPPLDPLFADYTVNSPWGFAWLVAIVSKSLNVSPFYSFAIINLICLFFSCIGIYIITGLLYKNHRAQIFSVLISLFAVTPFSQHLLIAIQSLFHNQQPEARATPVFVKFMNVNGNPVGILFFVLFLYAAIKLFKNGKPLTTGLILYVSFVGAGFFYAPVLPGMAASLAFLILFSLFKNLRSSTFSWKITLFLFLVFVLGIITIRPYFLTITSGVGSDIHFFNPLFVYKSTVNLLTALLPLLLIIFLMRKHLQSSIDRTAGMILLITIGSLTSCFLFVHILDSAEYKFLGLAGISIGILGGLAFEGIAQKKKWATLVLICLFILPSLDKYWRSIFRVRNHPIMSATETPSVYENGTQLFVNNHEEAELYHWIKENTSSDQLFIDTTLRLPIYAQRRLLTGVDQPDGNVEIGYSIYMDGFALRNGYDEDEFNLRTKIVRNVYGWESTMNRKKALEYLSQRSILIIVRKDNSTLPFQESGLRKIFRSSNGKYLIYRAF
ncbi:MAG: hypothetical protein ACQ9MH_18460 [Nitrospinales bacterium]